MKTRFTTTMYEGTDADGNTVRKPDLAGYEDSNPYTISGDNAGGTGVLVAVTGTPAEMDDIRAASTPTEVTDADAQTWRADRGLPPALEHSDIPDAEVDAELNAFAPADVLDTAEENRVRLIQNWTTDLDRGERQTLLGRYADDIPEGLNGVRGVLYAATDAEIADIIADFGVGPIPDHLDTATVARSVIQNQTVGRQTLQDQEVTAINKVAKAKGLNRAGELSKNTRADMDGTMSDRTERLLRGHHADAQDMVDYAAGRGSPPWAEGETPPAKGSTGGN